MNEIAETVRLTLESLPENATHWSLRSMASKVGYAPSTIHRIWQAFNLQPHRSEGFKLSTDPLFVDKVRDIVGLYLSPPEHAKVLCVDEKSQIHALDGIISNFVCGRAVEHYAAMALMKRRARKGHSKLHRQHQSGSQAIQVDQVS